MLFLRCFAMSVACVWLSSTAGCGDDDGGTDAGRDGGGIDDGGAPDAPSPTDGPTNDAPSPVDGGPPPGEMIAVEVCDGANAVAVSPDGTRVAFVHCPAAGPGHVLVQPLAGGEAVSLGMAVAETTVEWSPEGTHVLFGAAGVYEVRIADASADAIALGTDPIEDTRFVPVPAGSETRLLVMERTAASEVRVTMRSSASDYGTSVVVVDDDDLFRGDLSLVSASGNSLVFGRDFTSEVRYHRSPLDAVEAPVPVAFTEAEAVIAPVPVGDTHALARLADRLLWMGFETGLVREVASDGVIDDPTSLVPAADASSTIFYYYVRNGDPTRWRRGAAVNATTLVDADATALRVSPDGTWVVYPSGGALSSLASDGSGSPAILIGDFGSPADLQIAIAPDSSEVAAIAADGSLRRVPISAASMDAILDGSGVDGTLLTYDATSSSLYWVIASDAAGHVDALRTAAAAGAATTVGWDATGVWSVPSTSTVLYRSADGALRRITP